MSNVLHCLVQDVQCALYIVRIIYEQSTPIRDSAH